MDASPPKHMLKLDEDLLSSNRRHRNGPSRSPYYVRAPTDKFFSETGHDDAPGGQLNHTAPALELLLLYKFPTVVELYRTAGASSFRIPPPRV